MRRTLDLPDSPGVWIWRIPNDRGLCCVQMFVNPYGRLDCDIVDFYKQLPTGSTFQGPIEWEE